MKGDRAKAREFFGHYETCVLEDYRIRVPAEVRQQLAGSGAGNAWLGMMPGVKALDLRPAPTRGQLARELRRSYPELSRPGAERVFVASYRPVASDKEGRLHIPKHLVRHGGITPEGSVVIVGMGDHFEIWDEDSFSEMAASLEEQTG